MELALETEAPVCFSLFLHPAVSGCMAVSVPFLLPLLPLAETPRIRAAEPLRIPEVMKTVWPFPRDKSVEINSISTHFLCLVPRKQLSTVVLPVNARNRYSS